VHFLVYFCLNYMYISLICFRYQPDNNPVGSNHVAA